MSKSISTSGLNKILSSNKPPLIFDVRKKPAFDSDPRMLQGAQWKIHDDVETWSTDVSQDAKVVVYCVHGHAVSQNAAEALRDLGFDASFLEGGIATWIEEGHLLHKPCNLFE